MGFKIIYSKERNKTDWGPEKQGGEEMHEELGVIYPEPEKADEGHSKNDQLYVKQCH